MKKLTIKQQALSTYIIIGSLWILNGIMSLFDGFIFTISGLIASIILLVSVIWIMRIEIEEDDEMSVYNLRKAKAKTIDILLRFLFIVFIGYMLIEIFTEIELKILIKPLLPIAIGIMYVLTGTFFIKYEKDGE